MGGCCSCCFEGLTDGHIGPATFKRATKRSCTDVLFLILYTVFMAGTVAIAVVSYQQGDWRRLVYGYDDYGNICGVNNEDQPVEGAKLSGMDMRNKSLVNFMIFKNSFIGVDLDYRSLCVNSCPKVDYNDSSSIFNVYKQGESVCQYDVKPGNVIEYNKMVDQHKCSSFVYKSHALLKRCMPDVREGVKALTSYFEQISWLEYAFADVVSAWRQILGMCLVSVLIAGLMTIIVRCLAKFLIYLTTLLFVVGAVAAIGVVWYVYVSEYKDLQKIPEEERLSSMENQVKLFLGLAIAVTVVMVIVLLILIAMFPRMRTVVRLFEEASHVVQAIPLILFTPVFTFLVLALFCFYWLFVMLFVATAQKPEIDAGVVVQYVDTDAYVRYFWWYMVVAVVWGSEFIIACHQFVIAFATSKWYFFEPKEDLHCPIGKGIVCLLKNHLGSVALGSFIITLVRVPRIILLYVQKKCKGVENVVAQTILKAMQCCLWCLEKCLKYLNKNAYIVIAITGKSFCPSAQQAVVILVSNALRVAALNTVGTFVIFLCKLGVAAITAAIGLVWFKYSSRVCVQVHASICQDEDLHYYFVPAVVAAIFSYFVASCFFGVFDLVLDTLLVCVSEDSREQDAVDAPHECQTLKAQPRLMQQLKEAGDHYDTVKASRKKQPAQIYMGGDGGGGDAAGKQEQAV